MLRLTLTLTALLTPCLAAPACADPIEGSGNRSSEGSETTGDETTSSSDPSTTTAGPGSDTGTATTDEATTEEPTTGTTDPISTTDDTDPGGVCGDGVVDPGEECDLGPMNSDEGTCTSACVNAYCGDGLVGPGEGCDDGNAIDDDDCSNACVPQGCGDGVVMGDEQCDDGNQDDSDACLSTCVSASCGDGVVHEGVEACDDGNADNTDACTTSCLAPACDDVELNGDETDIDCGGSCKACALDQACLIDDDCATMTCHEGECEPAPVDVVSCADILGGDPNAPNGVYEIDPDGLGGVHPFDVHCLMEFKDGGGFTLVLKANGLEETFRYDAALWTETSVLNPLSADLDHQEAKLASYHTVPFTELLVGLEAPIANDPPTPEWLVAPLAGASLYALISPGDHVATNLGPAAWLALMTDAKLQPNCNQEGLNNRSDMPDYHRARIGIIGNEQMDCDTPDSRLGIGTQGSTGIGNDGASVGNAAAFIPMDNETYNTAAFGWVYVR